MLSCLVALAGAPGAAMSPRPMMGCSRSVVGVSSPQSGPVLRGSTCYPRVVRLVGPAAHYTIFESKERSEGFPIFGNGHHKPRGQYGNPAAPKSQRMFQFMGGRKSGSLGVGGHGALTAQHRRRRPAHLQPQCLRRGSSVRNRHQSTANSRATATISLRRRAELPRALASAMARACFLIAR